MSIGQDNFIWVYLDKEKLNEFIKLANDGFFAIVTNNNKQMIDILSAINSLTFYDLKKGNSVEIKNL